MFITSCPSLCYFIFVVVTTTCTSTCLWSLTCWFSEQKAVLLFLSSTVIIVTVLGLSVLRHLRLSGSFVKLWALRSLESWGLKTISSAWPWSYLCNNLQVTYGYRYKTDLSLKSCVFTPLFLTLLALFVSSSLKVLPPHPFFFFFFFSEWAKLKKIAFLCVWYFRAQQWWGNLGLCLKKTIVVVLHR